MHTSRRVLVTLALVAMVAALPVAEAGESTLKVTAPTPEPILPGDSARVKVKVVYEYGGSGEPNNPVKVRFDLRDEAPITAEITPDPLEIFVDKRSQRGTGEATLTLHAADEAQAFDEGRIRIDARTPSSGGVQGSSTSAFVIAQADYVPGFKIDPVDPSVTVKKGSLNRFRISVTNQGNGPIQVLLHEVETPAWVDLGLPPTDIVSARPGANQTQLTVRAVTSGDSGASPGLIQLKALHWYQFADSDTALESETISVRVEPTFPTTLLTAGIAVVGVAAFLLYWFRFR